MRQTKIVCTLGPATTGRDVLRGLLDAGMDAARFNLSYGTHEEHARTLALLRDLAGEMGRQGAGLFDLSRPQPRPPPAPVSRSSPIATRRCPATSVPATAPSSRTERSPCRYRRSWARRSSAPS